MSNMAELTSDEKKKISIETIANLYEIIETIYGELDRIEDDIELIESMLPEVPVDAEEF